MKKVLVIGSTVVDIIVQLEDRLPKTGEDVHVLSQRMSLGGCAYNVSDSIRHFQVPYILFSPIGTGVYGSFVRQELANRGISTPIPHALHGQRLLLLLRGKHGRAHLCMPPRRGISLSERMVSPGSPG